MTNLLWYICLSFIGVAIAVFTMYAKRHTYKISTLVIFYLFATSITWIGEFVALGIFNGYAYKPGIFPDPWAKNLTGHLLLNSTIWPGAATLMVAYSLGYGWISVIIAFFIFAEYLFLQLGIYEQHWWRYYMSVIIVAVFLAVCRIWFNKIIKMPNKATRAIIFYFVAFVIIHLPSPLLLLFGKQHYSLELLDNIVGNMYRSSIIFILLYHFIEAFVLVYFVCILSKWFWKLVPFAVSFVSQGIFTLKNILIFNDEWNLIYTMFFYALPIAVFIVIERYTLKPVDK